jgi:flagellar biosynthesis/type III secretory pathway ATPase
MTIKTRYESTCTITQEGTSKSVIAEVVSFNENSNLLVIMNKSVKLNMSWNGHVYEGRMAGMDFVSNGPKGQRYTEGR